MKKKTIKTNKPKLLYVLTSSISYLLIEGLIDKFTKNFDVYLITSFDLSLKRKCKKANIKYFSSPLRRNTSPIWDLICLIHSFILIWKIKPDIINFSTPKAAMLYSISSFFLRIKHRIYLIRGLRHQSLNGVSKIIQIYVERICCALSTQNVPLSGSVFNALKKIKLIDQTKFILIGPGGSGTLNERFTVPSYEQKIMARSKYNLKKDDFVIGHCGRIIPRKGIEELLKAFVNLRERIENVKLIFAGEYEDGSPLKPFLKNLIHSEEDIIYLGKIKHGELNDFYHTLDLLVSPSHQEGFSNVQIEAAMTALPIVATNITGSKDSTSDGFNGTLVEAKSVIALEDAILKYFKNKTFYYQHSKNSIFWSKKFTRSIVSSAWEAHYLNLMYK